MPTLSIDVRDVADVDLRTRGPVKARLVPSTTGYFGTDGRLRLSTHEIDLVDGIGTITSPVKSSDVGGVSFELRIEYADPRNSKRTWWPSGWFQFEVDCDLADVASIATPQPMPVESLQAKIDEAADNVRADTEAAAGDAQASKTAAATSATTASTAATSASGSATAAGTAKTAAESARDTAVAAAASATAPTDTQMAAKINDPASATSAALNGAIETVGGGMFGTTKVTVAASDTALPYRNRADVVCTGTNDLATIQAALDSLPDSNAVSGEVELLPGNYTDASGGTLSIGSPNSATANPRKVLRFHRGARLNVSGRTGRLAVIKVESPDCQVVNPNVAGSSAFGNGTGIAIGGDVATFGGRWDRVCNRVEVWEPILSNLATGLEFASIDSVGSTGDCKVHGGYFLQNQTGIRAAGYTNTVFAPTLANNNVAIWVEARRVEAQLRCHAPAIIDWNQIGIQIDGGFGSIFHDVWMEHVSSTGSTATEAIRFGTATTRAHFTRFSGLTHIQLVNEQYAVRYVSALSTKFEDLVISTSGAAPSVAVARNELASASKRNRIERLTFGPSTIPSNVPLSIDAAAWGDVWIDRIPGQVGDVAFSTRINPSTRASATPVVRKQADTSKTSDTTLAVDSDMTINLSPGTNYALTGLIIFDASQAGDFKMSLTVSAANSTIQWTGTGPASSHTSAVGVSSVTTQQATSGFVEAWGGAGAGIPIAVPISGIVKTGDLTTLTMSWAQNTSDATATILKNGSWLRLEQIP